ncbi:FAD-binding oxidoreductase [Aestuariivirga litoralis]|uniref:FAD-binding oxidoreductase n=1 Tax=Aestuariivirga litoralis TaxID=2650924 RepID=UPI0018C70DE1|nr:FAD-linked oxidase C-terminal domain-containing protein [Aestuariivirga litoralis]MBG1231146.1 FAD-binding protein [Aestuariivirga litoralis]
MEKSVSCDTVESMDKVAPGANVNRAIDAVRALLGDNRVSTAASVREQHGKDQTWNVGAAPDAVAFALSTDDVQAIVKICADEKVPVIAYGTGTSLEGHFSAPKGGICIDVSGMNNILEVNPEDQDCRVQAGVTRKTLNTALRDQGLFFPIDPGADASLGGMAATRASGTNAVRYGTMRENVMGLTVVMADGKVIRTGTRARKSSAGYDLTRLFVGSEGTLGIITEVQLKLYGIPEGIAAGICSFPSVEACCRTTIETIQLGIPVARIELLDAELVKALNAYSKLDMPVGPTLFVEFHGTPAGVAEQSQMFGEIAQGNGGSAINWATQEEDRAKLWQARHDAFWATKSLMPGKEALATDVCVPISRLAECVVETQKDLAEHNIYGPIVGHVGDGNFHVTLYCNRDDPEELKHVKGAYGRMIDRALAMGGTCTGEHGIGAGKRDYLLKEHGEAVGVMRALKLALDPDNLMNPGKNAGP